MFVALFQTGAVFTSVKCRKCIRLEIHILLTFSCSIMQALAVVTLGDYQMAQRIDNLVDTEESKSFYLQVFEIEGWMNYSSASQNKFFV